MDVDLTHRGLPSICRRLYVRACVCVCFSAVTLPLKSICLGLGLIVQLLDISCLKYMT